MFITGFLQCIIQPQPKKASKQEPKASSAQDLARIQPKITLDIGEQNVDLRCLSSHRNHLEHQRLETQRHFAFNTSSAFISQLRPIEVNRSGKVLDGHHRAFVALEQKKSCIKAVVVDDRMGNLQGKCHLADLKVI